MNVWRAYITLRCGEDMPVGTFTRRSDAVRAVRRAAGKGDRKRVRKLTVEAPDTLAQLVSLYWREAQASELRGGETGRERGRPTTKERAPDGGDMDGGP
jgi:hypothetical protein